MATFLQSEIRSCPWCFPPVSHWTALRKRNERTLPSSLMTLPVASETLDFIHHDQTLFKSDARFVVCHVIPYPVIVKV